MAACTVLFSWNTKTGIRLVNGAVVADDIVWNCNCPTCVQMRTAVVSGEALEPKMCQAKRGYEVPVLRRTRRSRFPDQNMCRKCFESDFFRMKPMPLQTPFGNYKVLFRASAHRWPEIKSMTADPPHHYLHSLEEGAESSKLEWACLHVGRHHSCHWPGHTCEMLSTSLLCSEAVRRLGPDRCLQVICVPPGCWDSGVVDLSCRASMDRYGARLAEHLRIHKIKARTLEDFAFTFREVVVDLRAVRAGRLHEWAAEFEHDSPLVQDLKQICQEANEFLHCESLGFLRAERECRSQIARRCLPVVR